jgi:glutamate carboxypeptidase
LTVTGLPAAAAERRDRLVAELLELSSHDAPSADPAASAGAVRWLEERLARLGADVECHHTEGGAVLEGRLGPGGGSPLLVLCHYDTVWPAGTAAARPARTEGGFVRGPGVFDMRGGIVAALAGIEMAAAKRPVQVLLTPDEETGSAGSGALISRHGAAAELVIVPEPPLPGGALKTARKGWASYRLSVAGRSAHAGLEPEKGASAIDELVDRLLDIRALGRPEAGTTVNAGAVQGGSAPNVVAASAWADLDVRATTRVEQERVHAALSGLTANREGTALELHTRVSRPPMERTDAIVAAIARAREIAAELGMELGEGSAGGASDGNLIAPLGTPVLDGMGPDGGGAHALDERVAVDSLTERAALVAALVRCW